VSQSSELELVTTKVIKDRPFSSHTIQAPTILKAIFFAAHEADIFIK
jgi:hypothetical protein